MLNVVSKLVWGAGVVLTLVLKRPLAGIAGAFLVSELLKTIVGAWLVRKHLALRWRFDWSAVKVAVVASLPIFLNVASHTIYNKLDVSIVAVVAGDKEVAWYGASSCSRG